MIDKEVLSFLQKAAETTVIFLKDNGVENDYGPTALNWLEKYITDQHHLWDDKVKDTIAQKIGAFFGECLIRAYNGEWDTTEFGTAVSIREGGNHLMVFPLSKVAKFMDAGEGDSFAMLFSVVHYQLSLSNDSPQTDQ